MVEFFVFSVLSVGHSFDVNGTSWKDATLSVKSSGQVLYAYVNMHLIGIV